MGSIRLGTSGFSYEDWRKHVYPASVRREGMLPYYSQIYPAVEINSTYYGVPKPAVTYQMTRKVPAGFEFVMKAPADVTHAAAASPAIAAEFRECLAPMQDEGMLGCILAQYPNGFRHSPSNVGRLHELRELFADLPVVVELRNDSWVRDEVREATLNTLTALELGYCCVDEPKLPGLMPPIALATSPVGYIRFHGRNAEKWYKHQHAYERYDYLYTEQELASWVERIVSVQDETERTYVFFNNHYLGQSHTNAQQMAALLNIDLGTIIPEQGVLPL